VERGYTEIVQILLEAGARPNTGLSESALESAISCGHVEITAMLFKFGARVSTINSYALPMAAVGGHFEIVQMLVNAGADPNQCQQDQVVPLTWAARNVHPAVFGYLAFLTKPMLRREAEITALHESGA
jgi:ankyrin repeat protein